MIERIIRSIILFTSREIRLLN